MALTKQDLDSIEGVVKSNVETIVESKLLPIRQEIKELRDDVKALREQIQELTVTLDKFLKRLTDHEEEFTILKAEMKQVKQVLKEKLGIDFKGAANW